MASISTKKKTKKITKNGRHRKGARVAKPNSGTSVSAAANGVTTALFLKITPKLRRMLDRLAKAKETSRAALIRGLIEAAAAK